MPSRARSCRGRPAGSPSPGPTPPMSRATAQPPPLRSRAVLRCPAGRAPIALAPVAAALHFQPRELSVLVVARVHPRAPDHCVAPAHHHSIAELREVLFLEKLEMGGLDL